MSFSLFPSIDGLLPWLPQETLFSLCSRLHRLWGHSLSSRSTEIMFGNKRSGSQHDLPAGLDVFALRTQGLLGTADQVARERTLLRFYRPFLGPQETEHAILTMRGAAVKHLKFRMGLLTSRFGANHPLKACPACMQTDGDEHGWVYWHMPHQYPGVWMCPLHVQPLQVSLVKSTGVERFLWNLPSAATLGAPWSSIEDTQAEALLRLSRLVVTLVEASGGDGWLSQDAVRAVVRRRLKDRGWLTQAGNARLTEAATDYLHHCAMLRVPAELGELAADLEEAKRQIGRLIRSPRTGTHPLRLLLAIDWLFAGPEDFLGVWGDVTAGHEGKETDPDEAATPLGAPNDERREQLVALMKSGVSATAAAKQMGVQVGTAMAWAAAAGIQLSRRPKVLVPEVRAAMVRGLAKGMDKSVTAREYGVSIETVTRLLLTEVGLHVAWQAARLAAARRESRSAWLRLRRRYPDLGLKMLRQMDAASYAWLYRNDRAWLIEQSPPRTARLPDGRKSAVRWDDRDRQLSSEVQAVAAQLAAGGGPVKLWQIYQALPQLKPKLSALDRLPLTARALDSALARRRHAMTADLFSPESPIAD
jgi:hypothetical protein